MLAYRRTMARVPRYVLPNGVSHVFARGNRYQPIFLYQSDAYEFLDRVAEAFSRFGLVLMTYCLMPTHVHFVVRGSQPDLSKTTQRLFGGYAQWFNREHGYRGHLFGDRFGAREIENEHYLFEAVRYVVLNPVRAGLCAHPREWRWSSYGATVGVRRKPAFLDLEWMTESISGVGFAAYVDEALANPVAAA